MATRTEEVRTRFSWDTKDAKRGGREIKESFDGILQSEKRVSHNVGELVRSFGEVKSGGDLVSASLFHIGETLKLGLGGTVAATAAYAAFNAIQSKGVEQVSKFAEVQSESEKAMHDARKASGSDSVESLIAGRERELDVIGKINDASVGISQAQSNIVTSVAQSVGLWTQAKSTQELVSDLMLRQKVAAQDIAKLDKAISESLGNQITLERLKAQGDSEGISKKQRELDLQKEINSAGGDTGKGENNPIIKQIRAKYAEIEKGEERRKDLTQRSADAELFIARLRGTSDEKALHAANARVSAAQHEFAITKEGTIEYTQALTKLQQELDKRREIRQQSDVSRNNTNVARGVASATLPILRAQSETYSPIEAQRLEYLKQYVQTQGEINKLDYEAKQDGADLQKIDAQRIQLASQLAQAKITLERAEADEVLNNKLALDAIKEQTDETKLQIGGQGKLAELYRMRYEFTVKINEANRTGHREQAAALLQQEALLEKQVYLQRFGGKSESSILHSLSRERRQQRHRGIIEARYDDKKGLINVHRDSSGSVIYGTDPFTGKIRSANEAPLKTESKTQPVDLGAKLDIANGFLQTISQKEGVS